MFLNLCMPCKSYRILCNAKEAIDLKKLLWYKCKICNDRELKTNAIVNKNVMTKISKTVILENLKSAIVRYSKILMPKNLKLMP